MSSVLTLNVDGKCGNNRQCICANKSNDITATRVSNTPVKGFTKHTHELKSRKTFTIDGKLSVGQIETGISIPNVQSVTVYYWDGDNNENTPLLIEIQDEYRKYDYYYNNGSSKWNKFSGDRYSQSEQLQDERLSKELDKFNCQYHKLVTLNITQSNSTNYSEQDTNGKNRYCCKEHGDQGRVSVDRVTISCKSHGSNRITFYTHSITEPGVKLAGVYYKGGYNTRKYIHSSELNFPINGVKSVYTFYCQGNVPKLIYVESTGNIQINKWYQKGSSNGNKDEKWEEVKDLHSIKPDDFNRDAECSEFKKLVDALKEFQCSYSTCTTESGNSLPGTQGLSVPDVLMNGLAGAPQYISGPGLQVHKGAGGDLSGSGGIQFSIGNTHITGASQDVQVQNFYGEKGLLNSTVDGVYAVLPLDQGPPPGQPVEVNGSDPPVEPNPKSDDKGEHTPGRAGSEGVPDEKNVLAKNSQDSEPLKQTQGGIVQSPGDTHQDGHGKPVVGAKEPPPPPPQQQQQVHQPVTKHEDRPGTSWIEPSVFGGIATVVSGLAGLAGYHLYKHTRDPWVRQI